MSIRNDQSGGIKGKILALEKKYGIFRAIKFGISGIVGFVISEIILALGVVTLYQKITVPSGDYASIPLILLNVLAFGTGVTVGFFVNESITVSDENKPKGKKNLVIRLLSFQLVNLVGNAITIGVQLALLATLGITPILGNIVGAVVAFPFSYLISMRFVWKINVTEISPKSAESEL